MNRNSIKLISHASVIINTPDCSILTDPWFFGRVFNNSWDLYPKSAWEDHLFNDVTHIWISHEHPDHFSIPTLKSFPKFFKEKVTVIYQKNNSMRIPKALNTFLGFKKIKLINNNQIFSLSSQTSIMITQVGLVPDSMLAVMSNGYTILNVNDCEINKKDCLGLKKRLGNIDVVLNQFSIAGYRGQSNYSTVLKNESKTILKNMTNNHKDLGTKTTIPFASFMYFCDTDNKYMNDFSNKIDDVKNAFDKENLNLSVLYPGDTLTLGKNYDSTKALKKYSKDYKLIEKLEYRVPEIIKLEIIKKNFENRQQQLKKYFPNWILKKCKELTFYINDLDKFILLSLHSGDFEEIKPIDYDISIGSEALNFGFEFTWGLSTIAVGAKYEVKNNWNIWKWYKIIATLNNSEIYLKPKYLFSLNNLIFFKSRASELPNQLFYKLQRLKE